MKSIEIVSLDIMSLKAVNGGSQESYEFGLKVGEIIHKLSNFWWLAVKI